MIKKLWNSKVFWYRWGICNIVLGAIVKDAILVLMGMILIFINRNKETKNDKGNN